MRNDLVVKVWMFTKKCQEKFGLHMEMEVGSKYIKLTRLEDKKPLCFVDKESGVIYRAKNEKEPLKKFPRGSVLDDSGLDYMTPEGTVKMPNGKPKGFKHDLIYPRGENKHLGPQPRLPKEKKGYAAHRPERIFAHTGPLVVVPEDAPAEVPLAQRLGVLPARIFTPKKD